MTDTSDTRSAELARTSEIYRRLRSTAPLKPSDGAIDLPAAQQANTPRSQAPDTVPSSPPDQQTGSRPFLRRLLTRRIDAREVLLILVTLAVLVVAYR